MKNIVISMWQFVTYFFIGIPLKLIFNVKTDYQFLYEKDKKYIIAANHPERIDPFLISYSFPLKDFVKLIPFRFITADKYMKNIFLKPILLLYGCITTKKLSSGTVLERSIKLLNRGETVFIFPSGEVEKKNKKYDPKIGVAYLENKVSHSKVIPVKIKYEKLPKKCVKVKYKESIEMKNEPITMDESAKKIYSQIRISGDLDKDTLYNLPWSIKDNPNGWIEPTTFCQLKCPGCYRGLAEKNPKRQHGSLESLKREVEWLKKHRNVQTISIAGGEPLCYPELDKLVKFISSEKLKTKIYTNGLALTNNRLRELKSAGVTELIIHIDKYQRNVESEEVLNKIRNNYCEMFRQEGGVNLGFIMPLSKKNISDIPALSNFYKDNSDIINLVVFTLYKDMLPDKIIDKNDIISMDEVASEIKKAFNLEYCAYLGKKNSEDISWLFSLSAYSEGEILGSFDKEFYKSIQKNYYNKKGRFFITIKNKPVPLSKLTPLISNYSVRKIISKLIKKGRTKLNSQVVLIIDAPDKRNNTWELCEGCPDAMLYNGKLVPSCLLERIKSGEDIYTY